MKYLLVAMLALAACSKTDVKPDPVLASTKVVDNVTIKGTSENAAWLVEDMVKAETAVLLTPTN